MSKRKTTEEFIQQAKEVHGDRYDYNEVGYINSKTKVKIICKVHGVFEQIPNTHLRGCGCIECNVCFKMNDESFIEKAKEVHGDKYDYSLVEIIRGETKVKIICKEHGVFEQSRYSHLNGNGCAKCGGSFKLDNMLFIKKSKEIHEDKYDYSLVEYKENKTKVKIICPIHGIFEQRPDGHLRGCGCVKCAGSFNYDIQGFIKKAKEIHGDKYDYSEVEYINSKTKVKIICPIHGIFEQAPKEHLINGRGCSICGGSNINTERFIERSKVIHNDKYDYSLVEYIISTKKVKIICPIHGVFEQKPKEHLKGKGCSVCSGNYMDAELFIEKSSKEHDDKYDYSLVEYINSKTKVKIICPTHGIFEQRTTIHMSGTGCPYCNESRGERTIRKILHRVGILYVRQKTFDGCKNTKPLFFDFYLPNINMCVEFDGKQHYIQDDFFGGEEGFKQIQLRDSIKNKYCEDNNIDLLRIRYDENIEEKLLEYLGIKKGE